MAEKGFREEPRPAEGLDVAQTVGSLDGAGLRIGIVVSRFNQALTTNLLTACVSALRACGVLCEDVAVAWVPGAYEVPTVVRRWAAEGGFDALVGLGCVIEGETPHAELVNHAVAQALCRAACDSGVPVINEVVGTRNLAQAEARCISGRGGRGWYAGLAAVEMARLLQRLDEQDPS